MFVPRHRSEFLVDQAAAVVSRGAVVVDLCCGSGAVGAALADAVPGIALHAADIDSVAVECARRNLARAEGRVYLGDLYDALPRALRGHVDVLVANVPYVPTADIALLPREARIYEPRVTLDGGEDGLDVVRRLARSALEWLGAGGHLLVETSDRQASAAVDIMSAAGLRARVAVDDDLEATVVVGKPSPGLRSDPAGASARRRPPRQRVDRHGDQEHKAGDDELALHCQAEQEHAVVDAADHEATENAVHHAAATAEQAGPADDRRGDGVERELTAVDVVGGAALVRRRTAGRRPPPSRSRGQRPGSGCGRA